jgi:methionine sulfoxide reductase heme-binding subunit
MSTTPSPLWFATRGAGTVSLLLLTAVTVLGVVGAVGWRTPLWPRFVSASLHRNLSLLAIALLVVHVATAVLDPFAHLGWRDAVVPAGSSYRPVWLGLGVLAVELLLAVAVTSLLRGRLGYRAWRLLHWLAYLCWPLALVHGLGTGTDAREAWSVMLDAACAGAVLAAVLWRLLGARRLWSPVRVWIGTSTLMAGVVLAAWSAHGPLAADWASRAGTVLPSAAPTPSVLRDAVDGTVATRDGVTIIAVRDRRDPSLLVVVRSSTAAGDAPSLRILRGTSTVCESPATVAAAVDAACKAGRVHLDLSGGPAVVTGQLVAWGGAPLP